MCLSVRARCDLHELYYNTSLNHQTTTGDLMIHMYLVFIFGNVLTCGICDICPLSVIYISLMLGIFNYISCQTPNTSHSTSIVSWLCWE